MNKNSTEPTYGKGDSNLQDIVFFMYFEILSVPLFTYFQFT